MDACTIPNRAALLARQFLRAFLPLFKAQKAPGRNAKALELDWWREEVRLIEIFKMALQIKTKLLLSTDIYRCIYHLPGTQRDDNMDPDPELSTVNPSLASRVALTLFPGLQGCSANERDLDFNRFPKDAHTRDEVSWETWCKPCVLLK